MIALFCARLALGMIGALVLLSPSQVNPRYYRTHFLTALAALVIVLLFGWWSYSVLMLILLGVGMALCVFGSISWSIENNPGGVATVWLTLAVLVGVFLTDDTWRFPLLPTDDARAYREAMVSLHPEVLTHRAARFVDDLTAAAMLGFVLSAMLMGHMYLIAPTMTLVPLMRLLGGLLTAVLVRAVLAGVSLWCWTQTPLAGTLTEVAWLWLPVRWGIGFVIPLVLCWMAWQSAKIRSTQSATGILYVAVVFCFLGELTGQLLWRETGLPL
jgi:hypothetical protein